VTAVLDRLVPLWTQPVGAWPDPAAFAEVYADPVLVNGTELALTGLIDRASALQRAFDGLGMQILDIVDAPGRVEHAPNAIDNFCFDVTLGYRRLELPRRVPARL
jgi:hypothetical protein